MRWCRCLRDDGDGADPYGDVLPIGVPTPVTPDGGRRRRAVWRCSPSDGRPHRLRPHPRDAAGKVTRIVEEKDATRDERQARR